MKLFPSITLVALLISGLQVHGQDRRETLDWIIENLDGHFESISPPDYEFARITFAFEGDQLVRTDIDRKNGAVSRQIYDLRKVTSVSFFLKQGLNRYDLTMNGKDCHRFEATGANFDMGMVQLNYHPSDEMLVKVKKAFEHLAELNQASLNKF